jgi:hypothetical protein
MSQSAAWVRQEGRVVLRGDVRKPGRFEEVIPGLFEPADGLAGKIVGKDWMLPIRAWHLANRLDGRRGKEDQPPERTLDGSSVSLGPGHSDGGEAVVQVAEVELRTIGPRRNLER